MKKILRIGHRGAMGYAPENTLLSFKKALELNLDMVEMDVFACKSGEIVAFHDHRLERTTNGRGYIVNKTLEELKALDAGKGEKIPTLQEVLDLLDKKVKVNIELKGKKTLVPVLRIIENYVQEKGWKHDDFILSSIQRGKLKKIFKKNLNIPIGALLAYRPFRFLRFAQKISAYSVHIHQRLIYRDFIEEAHKRGIKVFVWTVNEKKDIEYIKGMGVDGIFSDFPDRI